jgi:hypothetical protein
MSDLLVRDQSWPWAIPLRCTIRIRAPPAPHDLISEVGERKRKTQEKGARQKQRISTEEE